MLVFRRLLIIPATIFLIIVLFGAMLTRQINGTILNPDFYKDQLDSSDFYDFVVVDMTTKLVEQAYNGKADDANASGQFAIDDLGLEPQQIIDSVRNSLPPEWLQSESEAAIDAIVPYLAGDTDEFSYTPKPTERIEAINVELKALQRESRLYEIAVEDVASPAIETLVEQTVPGVIDFSRDDATNAVKNVFPRDWIHDNIDLIFDDVTAFLVSDANDVSIVIPLGDRAVPMTEELKALLIDIDAYESIYSNAVVPRLVSSVGGPVEIAEFVTIEQADIEQLAQTVITSEWIREQSERIIDESLPYLIGETDEFSVAIPLADVKVVARKSLTELLTEKVIASLDQRPTCPDDVSIAELFIAGSTLECIPEGASVEGIRRNAAVEISRVVDPLVDELIPDVADFTLADLEELGAAFGHDNVENKILTIRVLMSDGIVYTLGDFTKEMELAFGSPRNPNAVTERIEFVRNIVSGDWSFDQDALSRLLETQAGAESVEGLNSLRNQLQWVSFSPAILFFIAVLVLIAVAYLGGNDWRMRVMWSSGVLFVSSLVILAAWVPTFHYSFRNLIVDETVRLVIQTLGTGASSALVATKVGEITESFATVFNSGFRNVSAALMAVSLVTFVLALYPAIAIESYERLRPEIENLTERIYRMRMRLIRR